jgi:very-short-patch-repair endonuclease
MEKDIRQLLRRNHLKFETQKTFDWLVYEGKMFLDFFIPEYGVAIECQGGQHFKSVEWYGGDAMFERTKARDQRKKQLCNAHGIEVLYYSDIGIDFPYPVIEDMAMLINIIHSRGEVDPSQWKDPELPFPH